MKIFISHAVIDKDLAVEFKELLESATMGLAQAWLSSAIDGLTPGDTLWEEVHQNLLHSDKIIALITPNSLHRPWIPYECGFVAGNRHFNVIPVLVSLNKADLPLPLSAYVAYNADDAEDLLRLLIQTLAELAPNPSRPFIKSLVDSFISKTAPAKEQLDKIARDCARKNSATIRVLSKLEASGIIHEKLANPTVRNIYIIGYTNEVESGVMDHYHIVGSKRIEIFKRSIFSDLWQQQQVNIARIRRGKQKDLWDKRQKIIDSTMRLDEEFNGSDEVVIRQWFYDSAPTTRAYVFDSEEAILSFYQTCDDIIESKRSIYKGMGESSSVWVSNATPYGKQLIEGLVEEVKCLKMNSRLWNHERLMLENPNIGIGNVRMPILGLEAALFDLDGLLLNSMPHYVEAWTSGFATSGIKIADLDVYIHEGNSSRRTVLALFHKYLHRQPNEDELERIIDEKNRVLREMPPASPIDGADDLLKSVISSGVVPYLVTSSTRNDLVEELDTMFPGTFPPERIICGNDVKLGKPFPEPYLIACEKAKIEPCKAIVFENSPLGLSAARRAGINVIVINNGPISDEEFMMYCPMAIFDSCEEIAKVWHSIVKMLST